MANTIPLRLNSDGTLARFTTGEVIPVSMGGTGASTTTEAAGNILPAQEGHTGKVLSTDGSGTLSWVNQGQGPIGYTGSAGVDGATGPIGYTGSQGPIGYTGSQGTPSNIRTFNTIDTDTTLTTSHDVVSVIIPSVSITLPTAVGITGRTFTVINASTGNVYVNTNTTTSQTINNETRQQIPVNSAMTVISDGNNWRII